MQGTGGGRAGPGKRRSRLDPAWVASLLQWNGRDPEQRGERPMGYRNLRDCLADLERTGQLVRIDAEIDPYLEMAEIQRRVYAAGGPALYFASVKGCAFPMVSNLFGTLERTRFLFRDTLAAVRHLVELKIDPAAFWKHPWRYRDVPGTLLHALPQLRPQRADPRPPDDGEPVAAVEVLAARRRRLRHAAAGLHRGRGPARLAAFQPRHVSRAAVRQPIRAGSGGRPALPDSSRHRRPPRRGAAARRAVPRQRLRRRAAGADAGRRDAAAGRACRNWPSPGCWAAGACGWCGRRRRRAELVPADAGRGGFLHRRHRRSDTAAAGRAVRRPPRLLQPGPRLSRC